MAHSDKEKVTDEFKINTANIMSLLEKHKGNKNFGILYTNMFDELITYVEENKLAIHIKMGPHDSVNVVQLLHTDLEDVWKQTQMPVLKREKFSFLKALQSFPDARLTKLLKALLAIRKDSKIETWIKMVEEPKRKEMDLVDLAKMTNILFDYVDGLSRNLNNKTLLTSVENMNKNRMKYCSEQCYVDVINKRTLGKMMVKYVGNEGTADKAILRQLFQACIDNIQKTDARMWKDASVTIYDEEDTYKIMSGTEKHQFICSMHGDEPVITQGNTDSSEKCHVM